MKKEKETAQNDSSPDWKSQALNSPLTVKAPIGSGIRLCLLVFVWPPEQAPINSSKRSCGGPWRGWEDIRDPKLQIRVSDNEADAHENSFSQEDVCC